MRLYDGQSVTVAGYSRSASIFSCHCHSFGVPYSYSF